MSTRFRRATFAIGVVAALGLVGAASASAPSLPTDLFNPRGIAAGPGGSLFVAQSGAGLITQIGTKGNGSVSTFATLPTQSSDLGDLGPVDVAVSGLGSTYVLMSGPASSAGSPFAQLDRVQPNGKTSLIADIGAFEARPENLDPYDQGDPPFPEESNPNGLAVLSGNRILVADAANNSLPLIDKQGHITRVARFKPESLLWPAGLPFGPPEGTPVLVESVPTAVAVGPDGAWYVSELKGDPFIKGSSRIWRIEPGSVGAICDPEAPQSGPCRTVGTDFSSVIDLTFGADGTMYVLEIAKNGLGDVFFFGGPPIGALWAVKGGQKTELGAGTLLFPGGVVQGKNGALYVTTGAVFGPGAGAVVRVTD
jgi:sugar lactone lactonase YvrE